MSDAVDAPVYNSMCHAKMSIAPGAKRGDWSQSSSASESPSFHIDVNTTTNPIRRSIAIDGKFFHDNVARTPGSSFDKDIHGDILPHTPTVLTGLLDDWPAFKPTHPGRSWNVKDLAARTTNRVSLDGGPAFARMSICSGKVTMKEYQRYCENGADGDSAPLYVFDPDILSSTFVGDTAIDGPLAHTHDVSNSFATPPCFSNDVMACISGTEYRPLPPAWLLVGVTCSGTPIHNHPLTVAWNALLVGCKLWCCLPPDVDESLLLLNLDEDDDDSDFDLSAIDFFRQCQYGHDGPDISERDTGTATIIVQLPGEVVYVPAGWFHVVLNVETSTAISTSLALRRDLRTVLPLLMESDKEFADFWVDRLLLSKKRSSDTDTDTDTESNNGAYFDCLESSN